MDESNFLEEIKYWEHPPWYGSDQLKEKVTLIFLENQKGLFHHLATRFRMPVKQLMISGPCQETSYTAITLSPESNFTRWEKNHSLFHWNTWTSPELHIQTWMLSKSAASMIAGISMGQEICLITGQVSLCYILLEEKPPNGYLWSGEEINEKTADIQARSCGQNSGRKWERMPSWRRSKSGRMKSSIWITLENCEELISLTLRTRNLRRPSRMLARNWKHQWLSPCTARQTRTVSMVWLVVNPIRSNQNLHVFWKPMNLQDCVWENHCRLIMKTIEQEKEAIHYNITIWSQNLFLCLKSWKFPQQWTRNGENWRKFRRGIWKSEVRKMWSMKQGRRAQKFIAPHWWTSVIWRIPNWRQNTNNTKVELYVLRSDIVKDDSGSYAVFTEKRSSASQMTPAEVMDIISRLSGCAGQAADAISAYTKVKVEDAPKFWKFPNWNVQTFGFVNHDTNDLNHGPIWKIQSFLLSEIRMVILVQDFYGKGNLRKSYWIMAGRRFPTGNYHSYTVKKDYSFLCTWMTKIGWKETKHWSDVESTRQRSRFGRTNIFPWSRILGLHSKTLWNQQDIVDNYRAMFQSRISAGGTEKLPHSEIVRISSWSYDMEGHAKKCVEWYCVLANKTTQQLHKESTPCIDDHHFQQKELKSVRELSQVFSQIVLKCLYLALIGRPDTLWSVNKLARSISKWTKACEKRPSRLISYIHLTCEKTILSWGKQSQTMQAGTVSRLRFCGRSWGLEIYFWRNIMRFGKSYIRSNQLDV